MIPTCWYPKRERKRKKNARKTREKSKTQAQREKRFLYYIMRWAKTRVSCVLLAFCLRFAHKTYQNANPTHSVIWPYVYRVLSHMSLPSPLLSNLTSQSQGPHCIRQAEETGKMVQRNSLSVKTQGIWKFCQNKVNFVCSSCKCPDCKDQDCDIYYFPLFS